MCNSCGTDPCRFPSFTADDTRAAAEKLRNNPAPSWADLAARIRNAGRGRPLTHPDRIVVTDSEGDRHEFPYEPLPEPPDA